MENLTLMMVRCYLGVATSRPRDQRGDVPGWVMIVVMTAGLVAVVGSIARPQLASLLEAAFATVK